MTEHKDRNKGYVPTPTHGDELRPVFETIIGDPQTNNSNRLPVIVPVVLAQADELNRDHGSWWWAQMDPGSGDETPEHWSHFTGWDVRIGVELRTWNEREVNDWKGRDEIRKTGSWRLTFNEQVVYGNDRCDPLETLIKIRQVIKDMLALPIDWRTNVDYRTLIEDRPVYWQSTPATLGYWMPDQGCVMVKALDGHSFPRSAYDIDNDTGTDANPEYDYSEESKHEAKIHLLDPQLWWWRDRG